MTVKQANLAVPAKKGRKQSFLDFGGTGDGTGGPHITRACYHWATCPTPDWHFLNLCATKALTPLFPPGVQSCKNEKKNPQKAQTMIWEIQLGYINMDYQRLNKFPHWGRLSEEAREVTNDLVLGMITSVAINRKAGRSQKPIIGPLGSHIALVI